MRVSGPSLLPNQTQRRLLQAALLAGDRASDAWAAWQAEGHTIDRLDYSTQAILPQLYQHLHELGVEDDDMGRLKGAYRRCWYENLHVMRVVRPALSALADAGITTLICKGAALIIAYDRDPGARPMGDVDIVVRPVDAQKALELLTMAGYSPTESIEPFTALRVRRSLNLAGPGTDGGRVDLHWSTLPGPEPEPGTFDRAQSATFIDVPTLVLSPTDALFSILTHGTSWDPEPVRWILDGAFLLSHFGAAIDWELFVDRARDHRFAWQLAVALEVLDHEYEMKVPAGVVESLRDSDGTLTERVLHHLQRHPPSRGARWPYLYNEWQRARQASYPGGPAGSLVSFVGARLQATDHRDLLQRIWRHSPPWV